jgi:hypothetical protein
MRTLAAIVFAWVTLSAFAAGGQAPLQVDFAALVSRADLDYTTPATRSEEGQPIGNGRTGSLVWTTPSALHFQVNRVDVFGQDSYTTSFPKQDSDYASGCAFVDVNLVGAGEDVFAGPAFNQHLSVYDALMTARGNGVTARVLAWPRRDVIAIEMDDERERPEAISVDLRMLRYATPMIKGRSYELARTHTSIVETAEHSAESQLQVRDDGRIVLTQHFHEGDFHSRSAVAAMVIGRPSRARYLNETTVQVSAAAGKGKFTILLASAASLKPDADVAALALAELDAAAPRGFDGLAADTREWWHDFWAKGFVYMHSPDGQADFVERNYTYFLYVMGASSRGAFPPRFGGMLWYTNGNLSRWGSQYWWANTNAYYSNLMPANRLELMEPMFAMYSGMLDACALAARQQWGAQGVWIPEITFFNGPEKLPDDIAAELQDLMLLRKPFDRRSARFQWWAETKNRHNARWNFQGDGHFEHGHFVVPTKGAGIFGHCTHILADAARIGDLYYQRYLFTRDEGWLRERAYPVIRGAAEFYRTFPNVVKGDDGKYHIRHVNNNESGWDTGDTPMEISGMRTAFTNAVRASEILKVDGDVRPKWQEMLDNLASPASAGRGRRPATTAAAPTTSPAGDGRANRPFGAFVYGGPGAIPANPPDAALKARFLGFDALGSFIDAQGIGGPQIFRNRLRLREGPGAIDCEHLGGLVAGVHATLLNNARDAAGEALPIEVFSAGWPRSWDCAFRLLAHGGFVVTASLREGQLAFVRVESPLGGACRIRNPWAGQEVRVYRGEGEPQSLTGDVLTVETGAGESLLLCTGTSKPGTLAVPVR